MKFKSLTLECACGHHGEVQEATLRFRLGDPLTISDVMDALGKFKCTHCNSQNSFRIRDDSGRLLYDPEQARYCYNCDAIIPIPRIEALPHTRLCASCAEESAGGHSIPPYPNPPANLRKCPRCGSATSMYQNSKDRSWFVGCSTFPKCRWSKD